MLRLVFVLTIVTVGAYYTLLSPFYALLLYMWNAYFRPEDWVWTNFIASLHLSFIIGCYLVFSALIFTKRVVINWRIGMIIVFLVHTFISTILSEHFNYSWIFWVEFLKVIIITYIMITFVDDFLKFRLVLLVMALSLGLEGSKQGWFYLFTFAGGANHNSIAFLGDNNDVAIGMLMLVPIIAFLVQTTEKRWVILFYLMMLVGVLYRALTTYSRGGFLAFIIMSTAYCLYSQKKARMLFAFTAISVIMLSMLPEAFWKRMDTIQTYDEEKDASALGRFHYWQVALQMGAAHPYFGVGYNGYNQSYNDYDFSAGEYGRSRAAHNTLLSVIAELGYLGLAIYIIIILSSFEACYRVRKLAITAALPPHFAQSAVSLSASLLVFLVGGFFLTLPYREMVWHFFGLTIALKEIANRQNLQSVDTDLSKAAVRGG